MEALGLSIEALNALKGKGKNMPVGNSSEQLPLDKDKHFVNVLEGIDKSVEVSESNAISNLRGLHHYRTFDADAFGDLNKVNHIDNLLEVSSPVDITDVHLSAGIEESVTPFPADFSSLISNDKTTPFIHEQIQFEKNLIKVKDGIPTELDHINLSEDLLLPNDPVALQIIIDDPVAPTTSKSACPPIGSFGSGQDEEVVKQIADDFVDDPEGEDVYNGKEKEALNKVASVVEFDEGVSARQNSDNHIAANLLPKKEVFTNNREMMTSHESSLEGQKPELHFKPDMMEQKYDDTIEGTELRGSASLGLGPSKFEEDSFHNSVKKNSIKPLLVTQLDRFSTKEDPQQTSDKAIKTLENHSSEISPENMSEINKTVNIDPKVFSLKIKSDGTNVAVANDHIIGEEKTAATYQGIGKSESSLERSTSQHFQSPTVRMSPDQSPVLRAAIALNTRDAEWGLKLVAQIEKMHSDGIAKFDVSLRPKNLGDMKISLEFTRDEVQVRIVTETAAASRILSSTEDRLSQSLDASGFKLSTFSASSDSGTSQGFGQQSKHKQTPTFNENKVKGSEVKTNTEKTGQIHKGTVNVVA